MNCPSEQPSYRCEVHAEGPVYGTGLTAHHILGTHDTISPILAVRWLTSQALRIADRLDPDPNRSPWVRKAMRKTSVPEPDSPTQLRVWVGNPAKQQAARDRIKSGYPLLLLVPDTDCAYTLSIRPPHPPGSAMRQCEATTPLPPLGLLFAILAGQGRVLGNDLEYAPTHVRCELGTRHQGEHADHVWDWDHQPTHALWARWDIGGTLRYESLHWCETPGGPEGDACTLYRDHARRHSWAVHDPETDALLREARKSRPDST
ncbi:hypothetical protein ACFVT5_20880 [Streptomyces sp. NPDC058001]|uniref:hypothetical protein n=1 Tax=Streptomyces sp. NPDC058001 TaxID=3346300 RepID=UPI0036F0795A